MNIINIIYIHIYNHNHIVRSWQCGLGREFLIDAYLKNLWAQFKSSCVSRIEGWRKATSKGRVAAVKCEEIRKIIKHTGNNK